jgi:hypothetical protein
VALHSALVILISAADFNMSFCLISVNCATEVGYDLQTRQHLHSGEAGPYHHRYRRPRGCLAAVASLCFGCDQPVPVAVRVDAD